IRRSPASWSTRSVSTSADGRVATTTSGPRPTFAKLAAKVSRYGGPVTETEVGRSWTRSGRGGDAARSRAANEARAVIVSTTPSRGAPFPPALGRLQLDEQVAASDAAALLDVYRRDRRVERRGERSLHLHRLEHDERLPRRHAVARRDEQPEHRARHRRRDRARARLGAVLVCGGVDVRRRGGGGRRQVQPPGAAPDRVGGPCRRLRERRILDEEGGRRPSGAG